MVWILRKMLVLSKISVNLVIKETFKFKEWYHQERFLESFFFIFQNFQDTSRIC